MAAVFPYEIWRLPEGTPEQAEAKRTREMEHEEFVASLCRPLALTLAKAAPKTSSVMAEGRAEMYAIALTGLLRHCEFTPRKRGVDPLWRQANADLKEAMARCYYTGGQMDLPPPVNLVICADYALAFPGGLELREMLAVSLFSRRATTDLFQFQVVRWDGYWRDSMQRLMWEDIRDGNYVPPAPPDNDGPKRAGRPVDLDGLLEEPAETNLSRLRQKFQQDGRDDFRTYLKWIEDCRAAVRMPVSEEGRRY